MISVILKRPWFANQRINHMAIVDRVLATPQQAWHALHLTTRVPYRDRVDVNHDINPMSDQAARYRIRVAFDLNRTAAAHLDITNMVAVINLGRWKFAQLQLFLGKFLGPCRVAFIH